MGYLVLFGLLCLTIAAFTIYDSKGLPPAKDIPGWAVCVALAALIATTFLAGLGAILSAMFGG